MAAPAGRREPQPISHLLSVEDEIKTKGEKMEGRLVWASRRPIHLRRLCWKPQSRQGGRRRLFFFYTIWKILLVPRRHIIAYINESIPPHIATSIIIKYINKKLTVCIKLFHLRKFLYYNIYFENFTQKYYIYKKSFILAMGEYMDNFDRQRSITKRLFFLNI